MQRRVLSVPARLPQPCTVRHLVESYLDIAAVPRRSFFELLSTFATNELEREKLAEFSSAAGQDDLLSYCNRPRRTALEVTDESWSQCLAARSACFNSSFTFYHLYLLIDCVDDGKAPSGPALSVPGGKSCKYRFCLFSRCCRSWEIFHTPQQSSKWTISWTFFQRSSLAHSPLPPLFR